MAPTPDILRLAASGIPITEVARLLGIDASEAADLLAEAIKVRELVSVDLDGQRQLELAHLDMLRQALTPSALNGDIAAARILVRLHSARAALLFSIPPAADDDEPAEEVDDLERIRLARADRRTAT